MESTVIWDTYETFCKGDKFLFGVLGILAVFIFMLILRDVYAFGVDDSFIIFRYAENLTNGYGLSKINGK